MEKTIELLHGIDNLLGLGNEGLALTAEVDSTERIVKDFLSDNIPHETILWRKFDKWKCGPLWKDAYPPKYATSKQFKFIEPLRAFLVEFIDQQNIEIPTNQIFFKANSIYSGFRIMRDIFSLANKTIDIQDNYVGTNLLDLLEVSLIDKQNLVIRLLTKDGNYKDLNPFIKSFPIFKQQFPKIEVKSHDQAHGRFVVIDGKDVYNPGASIKDLGKKADLFTHILDDVVRQEMTSNFETWWNEGNLGVRIK